MLDICKGRNSNALIQMLTASTGITAFEFSALFLATSFSPRKKGREQRQSQPHRVRALKDYAGKDNVFRDSEQSGFYRRRLRTGRTGHPARVPRFSGRAGRRCRENVSFPCRAASRNGPDEGRSRRICRRHGAIRPSGRLFFAIVFYFCISERFLSVGMQRVRTIRSRNSD